MTWNSVDVSLWLVCQILSELATFLFKLYKPLNRCPILKLQWVKGNSYKRKMARFCQGAGKEKPSSVCVHAWVYMCVHTVASVLPFKGMLTTGQEKNSKHVISQLPPFCGFSGPFPLKHWDWPLTQCLADSHISSALILCAGNVLRFITQ